MGITNNLDSTRWQTFGYDQLNRVTAAQTTSTFSTSPSHCWGETYNLDPWGNLQSLAGGSSQYTGCTYETGFTKTADGNNHLSGFSYDASGNTTADGFNSYTWDAESQLKVTAGSTYLYDGDGRRVAKANTVTPPVPYKLYWYGSGGDILAETDASGNTTAEYIFFGGKRIAQVPASGNPIYYVEDLLGTSRVITTNTGAVCYDADFYPFGGERAPYTNTCPQNNYKFEGKERDTETGNDDFGARYYSNRFGRWLSADWSSVPIPVPYANLTNPQTLNLYAMVSDDPESFADLDGHSAGQPSGEQVPLGECPAGSGGGNSCPREPRVDCNGPLINCAPPLDQQPSTAPSGTTSAVSVPFPLISSGAAVGTAAGTAAAGGAVVGAAYILITSVTNTLIENNRGREQLAAIESTVAIENAHILLSKNKDTQKVIVGLLAAAATEIGKMAGPEGDPHHKKEVKAILDRAKRLAERLPGKAQEAVIKGIRALENKIPGGPL
jgi:RHS repeat-associated protein